MSVFALGIELDGEGAHPAAWRRAHHPESEAGREIGPTEDGNLRGKFAVVVGGRA